MASKMKGHKLHMEVDKSIKNNSNVILNTGTDDKLRIKFDISFTRGSCLYININKALSCI